MLWQNSLKIGAKVAEVNISSYPATDVTGSFFFCLAEILNLRGFVQKYYIQGVSCRNIPIKGFRAKNCSLVTDFGKFGELSLH